MDIYNAEMVIMQWMRERSKKYRLQLVNDLDRRGDPAYWYEYNNRMDECKKWCKQNNMWIWDDADHSIRFTNERDLTWFLLKWG